MCEGCDGLTEQVAAGFFGGWIDDVLNWLVNTLSSIPPLLLFLVISALWEPSVELLIVILALLG